MSDTAGEWFLYLGIYLLVGGIVGFVVAWVDGGREAADNRFQFGCGLFWPLFFAFLLIAIGCRMGQRMTKK